MYLELVIKYILIYIVKVENQKVSHFTILLLNSLFIFVIYPFLLYLYKYPILLFFIYLFPFLIHDKQFTNFFTKLINEDH